ncbi:hypothetical protein ACQJBY_038872 [Aegilops geniculata]
MTNVTYFHTFSTGCVDLIFSMVFFLHCDFFKFACDMVCGATVDIPIGVNPVGAICSCGDLVLILGVIFIFLIAVPTVFGCVVHLSIDLTARSVRARPARTTSETPPIARSPAAAAVSATT